MSAVGERTALDSPVPLYDHAVQLLRDTPNGPLPDGGRPFPDEAQQPARPLSGRRERAEVKAALKSLLGSFFANAESSPAELQAPLCALAISETTVFEVLSSLQGLDQHRVGEAASALLRTGAHRRAVWLGLGLATLSGRPVDTQVIRTLGLLSCCTFAAVKALELLPGTTADLVWLADRLDGRRRKEAVRALRTRADDPLARDWLLHNPPDPLRTSPSEARKIAEATELAQALALTPGDVRLLEQALRLMVASISPRDYQAEIRRYADAPQVYRHLAEHANKLSPSIERYAHLVSLVQDLHSGQSHLLEWAPGEREQTLHSLRELLGHPQWAAVVAAARSSTDQNTRWRTRWLDHLPTALLDPTPRPPGEDMRLSVQAAVPDPAGAGGVEVRILVDGRPVIAEAFDRGTGHSPDLLLERGLLRAHEEPHEVQLAEAWCTEGCCGALYVTIVRDGDTVLWHNWRRPPAPKSEPPLPQLPELRFDAAQYDTEITRAENDHSWEWPARTVARLLRQHIREQPEILERWGCRAGWISTHYAHHDQVQLTFTYPRRPSARSDDDPWLQFGWTIPDNNAPVHEQAQAALRRLATANPTTWADVIGGSREHAQALGFPWPPEQDCSG